jgi:4-amino-4-deoxy-L-arabinose transferase-like glycosyltransferase
LHSNAKSETTMCVALFLLAAIVRVLFLAGTVDRDLPFSIFYYGDSRIYREFALALIRGDVFDQGMPFHPPAFAYLLSWTIGWVGERPFAMRSILAIAAASVVPLTYLLGRTLWSRPVGVVAALLATFSFGLCVAAVAVNTETLYIPLLVAQGLLLVLLGDALAADRKRTAVILGVGSGILLGLGSLTRAEHLGLVVILPLALAIGWPTIPRRRVGVAAAGLLGVGLLVISPWTIHNHLALSRVNTATPAPAEPLPTWAAVSGSGPLTFALANNANSDGTFRPEALVPRMGHGRFDLQDPAQVDLYVHGYRRGWSFLAGNPRAAASLLVRKIALASDAHALGFGLSNWPGRLTGTRRPVDVFTPDFDLWKPVCWILLAAGIWVSRPVLRRGAILWLAGLHGVAVTLAAFGYARLFLQTVPFVFLFQAAALVALASRLRTPAARRAVTVLGAALAMALTVELALSAAQPRNFRASGSLDPTTGKLLQDAAVELEPVPSSK